LCKQTTTTTAEAAATSNNNNNNIKSNNKDEPTQIGQTTKQETEVRQGLLTAVLVSLSLSLNI